MESTPPPAPAPTRATPLSAAWRVVVVYAAFAALWIAASDATLAWLITDPKLLALVGTLKGGAFVVVTAALLYALVRRFERAQQQAFAREREALQAQGHALQLLHTIAESSPDAIFAKDRAGRYLLFNIAAARFTGTPSEQVIGSDDSAIFPTGQAAMIRVNDARVMAQDHSETFEETLDTAQGRVTFLSTKGPLHDAAGAVTGMFGISRDITELLATQQRLRDVLDRVTDGLLALDREQRYTYANRRAAQLLGRSEPADLIGRHIGTEFPETVGSSFERACEQAMATQQPVLVQEYFAAGQRWFEGRLYPSPTGLSIYFTDVTERRGVEQALRRSEQRFRLAASLGQVWDWDVASGRVDFPAQFWRQLGCEPPPVQDNVSRLEALMHPDDLPLWRAALREHLLQRAPYDIEFRARHADSSWRWFHTQGQAVWDAAGHATYLAGTTFDISARKLAEAALRESESYRRNLFDQLGDGVLLLDRTHHILDANPRALAILGYARDELLRLRLHDVLAGFEHPRLDREVSVMMDGTPHLAEWEHVRRNGSHFPAEVSARPLDGARYLAVLRDISARRQTEQVLMTTQLELSELTQRLLAQEKATMQRVAQALHDHLGQTLAVARLNLDACISTHGATMPGALQEQSRRIAALLDQAVREVRTVLADLRPPLLEAQGLAAALDNEIRSSVVAGRGVDVLLEVADTAHGRRWPDDVEYGAFMVAREAIANALQHARATLIRVVLDGGAGALSLEVIDDGSTIPAPVVHGRPGHLGIVGMRERAIAIGARFSVGAGSGGGTRVSLTWEARQP